MRDGWVSFREPNNCVDVDVPHELGSVTSSLRNSDNGRPPNKSSQNSTQCFRPHLKGARMATYFLFGAVGQCPQCKDHRFSGPARLATDTPVTCHKCGYVCTVEAAVAAAL